MKSVFITGTDTEVGKTVVTGLLAKFLADKGISVITQKWIQTGSESFPADIETHLKLMGKDKASIEKYLTLICPYIFKLPASPHLAAALENKKIDPCKIKKAFTELKNKFDTVIVEGIGGALVPFSEKELLIDIAMDLDIPIIIVVKNKLGAINHTLLTIEALQNRNMKILGVIFNSAENENEQIAADNPKIINALTQVKVLGTLPWSKNESLLHRAFENIGHNILNTQKEL